MNNTVTPISSRELLAYQADVKGAIFRQIRETFSRLKQTGFTQKDLAFKIGMNEGQLSRRLRGDYDLRLETLSDLARGLDCRIDVKLAPISSASVCESDLTASGSVSKSVEFQEASTTWDKYHEMIHRKMLKDRHPKESENFLIDPSKPSARRCTERHTLGGRRSIKKRTVAPKHSPTDIKLYALYKK
jgi:transcriptional regulator with XRE-family HTH domain